MSKSKWNNKSSVSIENLTENELKEAISEWAEGSPQLEALLWNCYNNGIETTACDAGDHHFAYFDILLDKSSDKMKNLINGALNFGNSYIGYRRVGNPFSGPDWYRPILDFAPIVRKNASHFYECMNLTFADDFESNCKLYDALKPLFDFFNTKNHFVKIWIKVEDSSKYLFNFTYYSNVIFFKCFEDIFEKLNFKLVSKEENGKEWRYSACDFEDLLNVIKKVYDLISKSEILMEEIPYDETMHFFCRALLMRKQFGTDRHGINLMNEWLNQRKYYPELADADY